MPAIEDKFKHCQTNLMTVPDDGFPITPNDNADFPELIREIWVGNAGNLTVVMKSGVELTFENVPSGYMFQGRFRGVKETGTDATSLVGLV